MLNAKDWLVEMLGKRGLGTPDGRMLFKYRLTQEEYVSAREVLHAAWLASSNSAQFLGARTTCALFVLYAAEWWRRDYAGGPWRWTPIVQSFVLANESLPAQDRTHALIRGIHHWRHLPGSEGKKYFGVLVAHGGLPMRLISQGGSKIRAVLSSALRLALRYRWDEDGIEAAIAERGGELSQPLRHAEIFALMARIVVVILELRHEFSLTGLANPIGALDAKDPLWRDRFPLSLDEVAAQQLLSGLVDEAAQQPAPAGANGFRVERLLRAVTEGRFEVSSFVRHPSEMTSDVFASVFNLEKEGIPRYFTVDVQVKDRLPLCHGRQILGSESATISLMSRHPQWRGEEACREHLMYVCSSAGELTDGAVPATGGAAISPEDPWIFAQRDEQPVLVSTGSARLPEQEAVVVCAAASWRIELAGPGSMVRPLGKCIGLGIDLDVLSIIGDVRIVGQGATYRVRTGQVTNAPSQYVWEGRRLAFQASSLPIYAGAPKLYRYSLDGDRARVVPAQLRWYASGQPDKPIGDPSRFLGPVDVWLMEGEERQVRFKLIILDPAARVNFRSGTSEREGSVAFVGWGAAEISMASDGIEWSCTQVDLGKCVNLTVDKQPPQSVAVSIKWTGSPREVCLTLPFPATGGRFFGAKGEAMPRDGVLPLQSIQGARLRVFDQNPQAPKQYKVRLTLSASWTAGGTPRLESEHEVLLDRDGTGEVRLIDLQLPVQRLMGFSDELDARVCVSLHAGPTSLGRIYITRYASALSSAPAELRLLEADLSLLDLETLARVGLCAHAFTYVGCTPAVIAQTVSEGTLTGVWSTTTLDSVRAPWLLMPTADSAIQFRPMLWSPTEHVKAEPEKASRCPLGEAMAIGNADERFVQMSQVIAAMSVDFAHASWGLLEQNLAALRHLPLASQDWWRSVARNPTAAVACAFRLQCSDSELLGLVRQLRDELGFVWELTSILMWSDAAKRLKPHYALSLGEDLCAQVFPSFFAARVMLLSSEVPALALPMQLTLLDIGAQPTADVINGMRQISKPWKTVADELWRGPDSLVQKLLLRAHSSDTAWPNFGLTQQAMSAFSDAVPEALSRMAVAHLKDWLWLPTGRPDHRLDVANVPVICALWSVVAVPLDWWQLKEKALALKRIRGFDPLWFEAAYRQAILIFMATGLSQPTRPISQGLVMGKHSSAQQVAIIQ